MEEGRGKGYGTNLGSSSSTFAAILINMQTAIGLLNTLAAFPPFPPLSC